jgi:hypothetical protein
MNNVTYLKYHPKKCLNQAKAFLSPKKKRICDWCHVMKKFKLKWITCKANPIGSVEKVCDQCVETTCKGR